MIKKYITNVNNQMFHSSTKLNLTKSQIIVIENVKKNNNYLVMFFY